jgi:hypothetical protein
MGWISKLPGFEAEQPDTADLIGPTDDTVINWAPYDARKAIRSSSATEERSTAEPPATAQTPISGDKYR